MHSEWGRRTCRFLHLFCFNPRDSHTHHTAIVQLKPLYAWQSVGAWVCSPLSTGQITHRCTYSCIKFPWGIMQLRWHAHTHNSKLLIRQTHLYIGCFYLGFASAKGETQINKIYYFVMIHPSIFYGLIPELNRGGGVLESIPADNGQFRITN